MIDKANAGLTKSGSTHTPRLPRESKPRVSWKEVWHRGFVPQLSNEQLWNLRVALLNDSDEIIQGATVAPLACCPVAFTGRREACTGEDLYRHFARLCEQADANFNEPAACRYLLNWIDETPRDLMRAELINEIDVALKQRSKDHGN